MSKPQSTVSFLYDDKAAVSAGRSLSLDPWITELDSCLLLGNLAACTDERILRSRGITAIVSLGRDAHEDTLRTGSNRDIIPPTNHLLVACDDTPDMNILSLFPEICQFIDDQVGEGTTSNGSNGDHYIQRPPSGHSSRSRDSHCAPGRVLVHCAQGRSRAPTVCIAWLMRKRQQGVDPIMAEVKNKRDIRPRENFLHQLRIWEDVRFDLWEDSEGRLPKPEYQLFLDRHAEKLRSKEELEAQYFERLERSGGDGR